MFTRRMTIILSAAALFTATVPQTSRAEAQESDRAIALVAETGRQLIAIAESKDSAGGKHRRLVEIVNLAVDLDDLGHFCLGHFWSSATADQQALYMDQFRELMILKMASYLRGYQGATMSVGSTWEAAGLHYVATVIERPDSPPMAVNWVVSTLSGRARIADLQAGGTSLRLTQRADFISFLTHHENDIDQLNDGMRKMVAWNRD